MQRRHGGKIDLKKFDIFDAQKVNRGNFPGKWPRHVLSPHFFLIHDHARHCASSLVISFFLSLMTSLAVVVSLASNVAAAASLA